MTQLSEAGSAVPAATNGAAQHGMPADGRVRVVIEAVSPLVDGGAFPAKRVAGDTLHVEADIFCDSAEELGASLILQHPNGRQTEHAMVKFDNDRWWAEAEVPEPGAYTYNIEGWIRRYASWLTVVERRPRGHKDLRAEFDHAADLLEEAAGRAAGDDAHRLQSAADRFRGEVDDEAYDVARQIAALADRYESRQHCSRFGHDIPLTVDPPHAAFSAWYEFFPRSTSGSEGCHGTFRDAQRALPGIAGMGFDVVYLPPIHPVGTTGRKGRNGRGGAAPDDPGSPWAIGSPDGGHDAVNPQLGSLEDFARFLGAASEHGIRVAIDLAFQCSPDHPAIHEHPQWFKWRPDGTIRHAENPPKSYEDIVPFDFETSDWRGLWQYLYEVVETWVDRGVTIFRVDNPHTKVGSSRVDLQACKLEYSIVSPK